MRRAIHIALAAMLAAAPACLGQDARLANGVPIKGEVRGATDAGLEIQTPTGPKTYGWETLSIATRYRHQPLYRANYEAVLQGLPSSAWTNAPDAYDEPKKEPAPAQATVPAATTQAVARTDSLNVFEQLEYENVDPIPVSKFPGLQLRSPALAAYVGLQYGPRKNDVVYLAFDTKSAEDPRDALFVYSPGNPAFGSTVKLGGIKKSSPEGRVSNLKEFGLTSEFGQVSAGFSVGCSFSSAQINTLLLSIGCELSKGDNKSRFVLTGPTADLVLGEGIIVVKGILDLPVLWLSLDMTAGAPQLVGSLNMSHLKLVPKEGMDNRVSITVTDAKGEPVLREQYKLDESQAAEKYSIVCELKKTVSGQTYTVNASIDLGPFLGPVAFEEKITIPKTQVAP